MLLLLLTLLLNSFCYSHGQTISALRRPSRTRGNVDVDDLRQGGHDETVNKDSTQVVQQRVGVQTLKVYGLLREQQAPTGARKAA